jgi:hypothetical protein
MDNAPLVVQPRFSMWLCFYMSIVFSFAIICVYMSSIPVWVGSVLSLLLVLIYVVYARRYLYFSSQKSLIYVLFDPVTVCQLHLANGRHVSARWLPNSYINQYLMVLRFKALGDGKCYRLILFFDSASAACLRELRRRITMASLLDASK